MITKRIIPCLDVRDSVVVKGVQFKNHETVGDIVDLAKKYSEQGADELVFYDITASTENRSVSKIWVEKVAEVINIPFCVAGGIRSTEDARVILKSGADKISINSPALENPDLIEQIASEFGRQCVVIGIDSMEIDGDYFVYKYTGSEITSTPSGKKTIDWVKAVENLGAGEIVLNCMNQDGTRSGYDTKQLSIVRDAVSIPLIASGGAGNMEDFKDVFTKSRVDGALAASVFHKGTIKIADLKTSLSSSGIPIRL